MKFKNNDYFLINPCISNSCMKFFLTTHFLFVHTLCYINLSTSSTMPFWRRGLIETVEMNFVQIYMQLITFAHLKKVFGSTNFYQILGK